MTHDEMMKTGTADLFIHIDQIQRENARLKAELILKESERRTYMTKWGHAIGEMDRLKEELTSLRRQGEPRLWMKKNSDVVSPAIKAAHPEDYAEYNIPLYLAPPAFEGKP